MGWGGGGCMGGSGARGDVSAAEPMIGRNGGTEGMGRTAAGMGIRADDSGAARTPKTQKMPKLMARAPVDRMWEPQSRQPTRARWPGIDRIFLARDGSQIWTSPLLVPTAR